MPLAVFLCPSQPILIHTSLTVLWASSAWLSCLVSSQAREPQLEIRGTEERGIYSHGVLPTDSSLASHINYQNSLAACLNMASLTVHLPGFLCPCSLGPTGSHSCSPSPFHPSFGGGSLHTNYLLYTATECVLCSLLGPYLKMAVQNSQILIGMRT